MGPSIIHSKWNEQVKAYYKIRHMRYALQWSSRIYFLETQCSINATKSKAIGQNDLDITFLGNWRYVVESR